MSELRNNPARQPRLARQPTGNVAKREVRLPYVAGLDGLRALAAVVVLLYHADIPWMPGGFLGVEVFFVLSGYLITSLLLAEWRQTSHIDVTKFWLRRVRRLFPAMLFMTAASVAYAVLFLPGEVAGLRNDAVAGLGYATNWYLIFSRTSYFESVGRPSLLRHLWSLAIEGQFYIVWPLVFSFVVRGWKGRWVPLMAFLGAMASTALMAWLYQPDIDPSRVYYGADTRASGFLFGAVLAFLPLARRSAKGLVPWLLDLAGLASLGLLAWACVFVSAYQPLLYRGGLAVVGAETALVIAAIVRPGTRLVAGLLGWRPLRWIGLRSYGIYLWHWPVFMLTRPQLDLPLDGAPLLALRFALTLILTEVSYRCVEKPLHLGALGRARQAYRQARGSHRWALGLRGVAVFLALTVASTVLGRAVVNSQPSVPAWYVDQGSVRTILSTPTTVPAGEVQEIAAPTVSSTSPLASEPASPAPTAPDVDQAPSVTSQPALTIFVATPTAQAKDEVSAVALALTVAAPMPSRQPTVSSLPGASSFPVATASSLPPMPPVIPESTTLPPAIPLATWTVDQEGIRQPSPSPTAQAHSAARVTAVGDSVMVSAAGRLTEAIDGLAIDAAIGRQMREVIEVLQEILDAGQMGDVVIIQVGNNGYLSTKKFDEMMLLLKDVRTVLVLNCRVPRQWEATVNTVLAEGVQQYPNATLIDWYAASADHPEFFWNDGMHLRPEGAEVYTELIAEQINKFAQHPIR